MPRIPELLVRLAKSHFLGTGTPLVAHPLADPEAGVGRRTS
jgi:hypothetical protein